MTGCRRQAFGERDFPDNVGKRPVGDALAIGQAATVRDRYVLVEPAGELQNKPRLTHTRVAQHGQQMASTIADHVLENCLEYRTLALTPYKGGIEATRKAWSMGDDVYHDKGMELLAVLKRARPARL